MGYDVHITRAAEWSDSESTPILASEWLAVISTDPELRLDIANGPHDVLWVRGDGAILCPFWWSEGRIYTKNPDDAAIMKMLEIATRLGAVVQGDEGETYPVLE